jgi:hypothetical protein
VASTCPPCRIFSPGLGLVAITTPLATDSLKVGWKTMLIPAPSATSSAWLWVSEPSAGAVVNRPSV